MDLNIVTTAELTRRHQLGWSSAQAAIRCSAFHPSEPQLFVATEDDIFSACPFHVPLSFVFCFIKVNVSASLSNSRKSKARTFRSANSGSMSIYCRIDLTFVLSIVVDAMQGQIMSRFTVNSGQVVQIFTCAKEPLLGALVALEEVRSKIPFD